MLLVLISFVYSISVFFQVTFEGEHSGNSPHGDITIDDVSFTPECRPAPHGTVSYLLVLDIKWSSLAVEKYVAFLVGILRDSLLLSCFLLFYILENVTCRDGTFACGSGECISFSHQCDFNDDCFDGSDELYCGKLSFALFCYFSLFYISLSGAKLKLRTRGRHIFAKYAQYFIIVCFLFLVVKQGVRAHAQHA